MTDLVQWNNCAGCMRKRSLLSENPRIWVLFGNVRRKFKFYYNRTRITGNLHEDQYIFLIISRSVFLRTRIIWEKFVEKIETHINVYWPFFDNRAFYEIMWKNILEPGRPQIKIRRMGFACWIIKATNTHPEYVILICHWNNGCKNAPSCHVIRNLPLLL